MEQARILMYRATFATGGARGSPEADNEQTLTLWEAQLGGSQIVPFDDFGRPKCRETTREALIAIRVG
jgi:hypothetical protein